MPVARIISDRSSDTSALRLRLEREGYSVESAAPGDTADGADLLIEVESVEAADALDRAASLASADDAVVIVGSGVVATPVEKSQIEPTVEPIPAEPLRLDDNVPAAPSYGSTDTNPAAAEPQYEQTVDLRTGSGAVLGLLGNTASDFKSAISESGDGVRESLSEVKTRVGSVLDELKRKRELAAEARRLERERAELEKEERRREQEVLQQQRIQAEMHAREERERIRREQEAQRHAAMEAERARLAAEADRIRQERERIAAERAAAIAAPVPPLVAPVPEFQQQPAAVAPGVWRGAPELQPRAQAPRSFATSTALRSGRRPAVPRMSPRDRKMQRAAFIASVVTLVAMLGFAAVINLHPSNPMSHSMVQNPVEEKTPFGPAQINQAQTVAKPAPPPAQHAAAPRTTLPQAEAPAVSRHHTTKPVRRHHRAGDDATAEDEVVVHHYGTAPAKHPPAAQTRAGVRRYSDSQ